MSKFTAWVTGRDANDEPYAEQLTVEAPRVQAEHALKDSLLPGERIQSVREGAGGTDITLRRES